MDCRKGLWLALGLWGAGGCQHTAPGVAGNTPPPAATPPATAVVSHKFDDSSRKLPRAETCVVYGDYKAGEACASSYSPSQRDRIRDDARKAYQQALELDPKCLPAQQGLARLAAASEDYTRAVAGYQKALKTAPKNAAVWFELGMCHNRMHHWDEALKAVARAAALEPENRTFVNAEAVLLARLGRQQESFECFARVTSEAQAHFNLARTLRQLDKPDLSKRQLELALAANPRLEAARALLTEMTPSAPARPARPSAAPAVQPASYREPAEEETRATEEPAQEEPAAEEPAQEENLAGPPQPDINLDAQDRPPDSPPERE